MTTISGRIRDWGLFVTIVLLLWPAIGLDLGQRDISRVMETNCMLRSQDMWLGLHRVPGAVVGPRGWLVASQNGRPTVTKPPMLLWLNQVAWIGLQPATASPEQLIWRARVVSAVMAMLVLAGIYAVGLLLEGRGFAAVAALAAGGMFWFFQRQARTASYDIHLAAWSTLAVAAALSAMPLGEFASSHARRAVGWSAAALCLTAAWLTKGPLALVWVVLPLLAIAISLPQKRGRVLLCLGGCLLAACVLVAPWYLYVLSSVATAEDAFQREYLATRTQAQPFYYYLALPALLFPWTLWFVGGLVAPWLDRQRLRTRLIPWLWLVCTFAFFSIPAAKQQRYVLPIVAPAALLIAQLAMVASRSVQADRSPPAWLRYLLGAHGWMLLVASFGFGLFLTAYPWLTSNGWAAVSLGPFPWRLGALLGLLLTAIALAVVRHVDACQFIRAAAWTGIWSALLGSVWWSLYDSGSGRDRPFRESATRLRAIVGDRPAFSYRPANSPSEFLHINKEFLFYLRRFLPALTREDVVAKQANPGSYVLAPNDGITEQELAELGYARLDRFSTGKKQPWTLWQAPLTAIQPTTAASSPSTQPSGSDALSHP